MGDKDHTEGLKEGKIGDKDQTDGLKEEDELLQVLLDMHDDVPLGDPGPSIASEDKEKGGAEATQ